MPKIKLVFVVKDFSVIGGVERVTEQLTNGLINFFDITILSLNKCNENIPYKLNENIQLKFLSIGSLSLKKILFLYYMKLFQLLNKEKPSFVIGMGSDASFIISLQFLKKYIFVYSDHGALINEIDNKKSTFVRKLCSSFADYIVTLTNKSKNDYINIFNINKKKIQYIYNPIKLTNSTYDSNNIKIISVLRFSYEKGLDNIIKIGVELNKINNDWQWDIYGDGDLKNDFLFLIKKYGLEKHIFLKGYNNNINSLYSEYGIYVMTSYREGLPLVLLEAKANKLPIISFNIDTGPSEIVQDSINGFLVEPYNVVEMAKKINFLLSNKKIRVLFSENSSIELEKFEYNHIINQWKGYFEERIGI